MAHTPLDPTHKKTGATKTTAGSTYDFRNNPKGTFGSPGDTSTPPKQGTMTKLKANADKYSGSNADSTSGPHVPTAAELAAFNKKVAAKKKATSPTKPASTVYRAPPPSRTHTASPSTPAPSHTMTSTIKPRTSTLSKKDRIRKMKSDRKATRAKDRLAKLKAKALKRASKTSSRRSKPSHVREATPPRDNIYSNVRVRPSITPATKAASKRAARAKARNARKANRPSRRIRRRR